MGRTRDRSDRHRHINTQNLGILMEETGMEELLAKKWLQFCGFKIEGAVESFMDITEELEGTPLEKKAFARQLLEVIFKEKVFNKVGKFEGDLILAGK